MEDDLFYIFSFIKHIKQVNSTPSLSPVGYVDAFVVEASALVAEEHVISEPLQELADNFGILFLFCL